jgi:alpha-1,6-mannosyltransferase
VISALLCLRLLFLVLRGRLDPVTGLGVGLGAVVLLGPVVHPWYLLWAAIPLAATRGMPRHRRAALAASALLAVMLPPTGADFAFRSFQLPLAILAGIAILLAALVIVRRELRAAGDAPQTQPPHVGDDLGEAPLDDDQDAPGSEREITAPPSRTAPRTPT